jgi:hypothetical protein
MAGSTASRSRPAGTTQSACTSRDRRFSTEAGPSRSRRRRAKRQGGLVRKTAELYADKPITRSDRHGGAAGTRLLHCSRLIRKKSGWTYGVLTNHITLPSHGQSMEAACGRPYCIINRSKLFRDLSDESCVALRQYGTSSRTSCYHPTDRSNPPCIASRQGELLECGSSTSIVAKLLIREA